MPRRERTRPEAFLEMELPMAGVQEQRYALRVLQKLKQVKHLQDETVFELDALMPSILSRTFRSGL